MEDFGSTSFIMIKQTWRRSLRDMPFSGARFIMPPVIFLTMTARFTILIALCHRSRAT